MIKLLGRIETEKELELLYAGLHKAGFPSPAADFMGDTIDLNKELIKHPSATYYARTSGDSLVGAGVMDNSLLIIDRSLKVQNNYLAVCIVDGEFTAKRIRMEKDGCFLMPENANYKPIKVTAENDFLIWGVVSHNINFHIKDQEKWWR